MRRITCRVLSIAIIVIMLISISIPAFAVQPRYAYTSIVAAGLSIKSGNAECFGEIIADSLSSSISMKVRLWKKTNGIWSVIKTWSATRSSSCTIDKDYSVTAGTYKVTVAGTVTTSSGAKENVTCDSNVKTYP